MGLYVCYWGCVTMRVSEHAHSSMRSLCIHLARHECVCMERGVCYQVGMTLCTYRSLHTESLYQSVCASTQLCFCLCLWVYSMFSLSSAFRGIYICTPEWCWSVFAASVSVCNCMAAAMHVHFCVHVGGYPCTCVYPVSAQ